MLGRDLDVGMGWLGTGAACFTQLFATKGPGGRGASLEATQSSPVSAQRDNWHQRYIRKAPPGCGETLELTLSFAFRPPFKPCRSFAPHEGSPYMYVCKPCSHSPSENAPSHCIHACKHTKAQP